MSKQFVWVALIFYFAMSPAGFLPAQEPSAAEQLERLLDEAWAFEMREDPLWATDVGDHRYNDQLPSQTVQDALRRGKARAAFLERLEAIDREQLAPEERINYDMFARTLRNDAAGLRFKTYLQPITNRSGFHIEFPELRWKTPLETADDYQKYIARLSAFEAYVDQHIQLMREGIEQGYVLPAVVLEGFDKPIATHIVKDPTQSLLYEPLTRFPERIEVEKREELAAAARQAIAESLVPGYEKFLAFMRDEYLPAARGSIGASALPDGRAYYRHRVERFTTLDLTPEEVHQIGLDEVKRIRGEMEDIIRRVKFEGDFHAFVAHLREEPKFYAATPEELLKEVAYVLKKMDGQLPRLFGKLPRTPYGIREIPAYIAPQTTTAYYQPPAGDGSWAGFYYVNTYDLKSRPLFEIEALSLHEAVPGHHLQLALQQELTGLPNFRRFSSVTAFIEGWGLYAERLGLEAGFYQDPYSDFGRLSYEMWRACRLVVDTGMHYLGWTRKQALDFMSENTALSQHNIRAEVDRYISWPGQALAYKIGELKIRSLRSQAEERLGDRFDIRKFHDAVLASGAVPLDVLETNIAAYIEKTLNQ